MGVIPPNVLTAALWMAGALLSFSTMAVAGRMLQPGMTTFEIMLFRSLIGLAVVLGIAAQTGRLSTLRLSRPGLHLVRNLCHFTGQNLWLFALTLIPLAHVFALEFTSPLWVTLLAPLFLAEPLTRLRAVAAVMGFVGVLVITQPSPSNINLGHVAAACAAVGFAGTAISTKLLTRSLPTMNILFWMTVIQLGLAVIACALHGRLQVPPATLFAPLVILSLAALFAHFCLTKALSLAPATIVFPIDFLRLPLITAVGALFYQEPANLALFLGAFIIFSANWLNLRSQK